MPTTMADANDVSTLIGIPVSQWPGRCHEIADLCVRRGAVQGHLRYGHYLGLVGQGYSGRVQHDALGFSRHGWVELPEGRVWDPTRWVFEDVAPYVYIGPNSDYDIGGNQFAEALLGPCPKFDDGETCYRLPDNQVGSWVAEQIGAQQAGVATASQLNWLANSPPDKISDCAGVYRLFADLGLRMDIPIDNWELILGE